MQLVRTILLQQQWELGFVACYVDALNAGRYFGVSLLCEGAHGSAGQNVYALNSGSRVASS